MKRVSEKICMWVLANTRQMGLQMVLSCLLAADDYASHNQQLHYATSVVLLHTDLQSVFDLRTNASAPKDQGEHS